jgi:hypothetical protein
LCCVVPVVFLLLTLFPTSGFSKMVGPYTGQVLDSRTGEPIQGASLFVSLTKYNIALSPAGSEFYPERVKSMLIYTDEKGKYSIPKTLFSTGIPGSLNSTTIIIYQPGYQAIIKKNSMWNKKPNRFKKKDNIIKLERIPTNFDHKSHYERISDEIGNMGDCPIIPPIDYLASSKGDIRVKWDKFIDKAQLNIPKEEFLRRVEWENRRQ